MREQSLLVDRNLQPVLHQLGRAAVQLVGPAFDVGEHVDDPAQVLEIRG